jgi:hypothetical protein
MYSSHRMSRGRIVLFCGQDFIAGYCGSDVQDVQYTCISKLLIEYKNFYVQSLFIQYREYLGITVSK